MLLTQEEKDKCDHLLIEAARYLHPAQPIDSLKQLMEIPGIICRGDLRKYYRYWRIK